MPETLERAIARFRRTAEPNGSAPARISAAAFRAAVEERLGALERELTEVKGRVNGLIFVVLGAVITQEVCSERDRDEAARGSRLSARGVGRPW